MSQHDMSIALKDVNGLKIGGTPKYVNNGNWISLNAQSMSISYKPNDNPRNIPNVRMKANTTFNERKGDTIYSGIANPVIIIDCSIDLNEVNGIVNTSTDTLTKITPELLFQIATLPITFYLKDWFGTGIGATYISILQNTVDYFTQTGWGTPSNIYGVNGIPVKVRAVTNIKRDVQSDEKGHMLTFKLELEEVKD